MGVLFISTTLETLVTKISYDNHGCVHQIVIVITSEVVVLSLVYVHTSFKIYFLRQRADSWSIFCLLFGVFFLSHLTVFHSSLLVMDFDLCSVFMANEQWRFFSVPNLLWLRASVCNGNLRGAMTSCFPLATAAETEYWWTKNYCYKGLVAKIHYLSL